MMNYPCYDDAAAAAPWCYPGGGVTGEAPAEATAAAGGDACSFADLIASYSTDELFELAAWEQQGEAAGASASAATPAACSRLWSPAPVAVRSDPPSEDEMAAWLCAIVRGDELVNVSNDHGGRQQEKPSNTSSTTTGRKKDDKLPMTTEGMGSTEQEMRKPRAGGSSRRSHHGQAHKLIEKRRRHKINERFRTLQQLVPGCDDKSNQSVTLDKTIQYMKLLQHQVQCNQAAPPPVAVPTMPEAPAMVLASGPTTIVVPLGAMLQLQLPRYPAPAVPVMMPAAAAAPVSAAGGAAPGDRDGHRQSCSS